MAEKSILEQALLQVQTLEEAVKQNAKGILASTMKQELNDLLKESEEEEIEVSEESDMEIPEEETEDMSEQPEEDSEDDEENDEDLDNEDSMDDEFSTDDDSMGDDLDSFGDEDSMDDDLDSFGDDDSMSNDLDSFGDEDSMDDDVMDMTKASDDEVLRVFKSMKPEDGIVVKKDGDDVALDLDGDEYIIKLDGDDDLSSNDMSDDEVFEGDMSDDEVFEGDMSDDDTIYEIELDEEDEMEESEEDTYEVEKIEATEAARTKSNPHGDKGPGQGRTGLKSKKTYKAGSGSLNEQMETLKKQNSEYKKALVLFKEKLNEVAVFNANLAYATRLFTEHSTTKQEKLNILKRFDSVSTMNESKNLFSTIKGELENKKPITESVVNKITNTPKSSSSQEILSEAKAYENPQFKRMKELIGKIK
jgi:hypothetical protein